MLYPKISVIVPVYNAEQFLQRCVSSILNQSYINIELILVDDGSDDHSGEICDAFAQQDNRVEVVHQFNVGVSSARNRGLELAKGDYLLFVDSDDALATDACERLVAVLNDGEKDCIIFGLLQDSGSIWASSKRIDYYSQAELRKDFVYLLNEELLSSPVNKLYKCSLIHTGFDEHISFGEDLLFNISYIKACERVCVITDLLYLHNNLNISSLTHTFKINRIDDIEIWQKSVLDFSAVDYTNSALYKKYLSDVLRYIKGLYGAKDISYRDKQEKLEQWYPQSHFSKWQGNFKGGLVDRFLYTCVRYQCWRLPYFCLSFKRKYQSLLGIRAN